MLTISAVTGPLTMVMTMVPPGDADPAATGHGPEWGKAAPIGLLVWVLLGLALFLLIKSLNRHLRRVPTTFDGDEKSGVGGEGAAGAAVGPASGATAAGSSADAASGDAGEGAGGGDETGPGDVAGSVTRGGTRQADPARTPTRRSVS